MRPPRASIESPTWGDLHRLAEAVAEILGGPAGAAKKLSFENYYTLSILASLNLDEEISKLFIFGKQYLT